MGGGARHERNPAAAEPARDRVVVERRRSGGPPGGRPAITCHVDLRRSTVSLTAADVAEIMRLLEQSSFDALDLEMNGVKLSLRRGGGEAGTATKVVTPAAKTSVASD